MAKAVGALIGGEAQARGEGRPHAWARVAAVSLCSAGLTRRQACGSLLLPEFKRSYVTNLHIFGHDHYTRYAPPT
jgi:hypothetical protein